MAEVLNFLGFQYNDFKLRAEKLAVEIKTEAETIAKQELSKVDVGAAKAAVDAVIVEQPKA